MFETQVRSTICTGRPLHKYMSGIALARACINLCLVETSEAEPHKTLFRDTVQYCSRSQFYLEAFQGAIALAATVSESRESESRTLRGAHRYNEGSDEPAGVGHLAWLFCGSTFRRKYIALTHALALHVWCTHGIL